MNVVPSDAESEAHRVASANMHAALRRLTGHRGKELSEFISNTCLRATNAFGQTSMEIVLEQTKTILTIFNASGPKSIGFDTHGSLPKFMVVADLFGKRCGFYSSTPTLIRELCSSFYGPVDCGFGNGSLIRHEIDVLAKQADALGCSLLLVLSAPWGTAIGDRFWRLCTVREESGLYIDSESTFSSMQRPPAKQGSSVLENTSDVVSCTAAAAAMCRDWRAIDIDSSFEPESAGGDGAMSTGPSDAQYSHQDSKMVSVMSDVIKNLRIRDKEQQSRIAELECVQDLEIQRRVSAAVETERKVWEADVESLHKSLDAHAKEVAIERVKVDALLKEIVNMDDVIMPACKVMADDFKTSLSELCGKQLVMEEEIKSCNKKLADARKRDTESKRERTAFESALDSKSTEIAALRTELQSLKERSDEAKRTASEQITSLLDARNEACSKVQALETSIQTTTDDADALREEILTKGSVIEDLKAKIQTLEGDIEKELDTKKATAERSAATLKKLELDLKAARACALWTISIYRTKYKPISSSSPDSPVPTEVTVESDDQSTDGRGTTGGGAQDQDKVCDSAVNELRHMDLLNLVASTKGLMAHLNSFVEKVQSGGGLGTAQRPQQHSEQRSPPPQQFQQYPHATYEQWHQGSPPPDAQQYHQPYFEQSMFPYMHHPYPPSAYPPHTFTPPPQTARIPYNRAKNGRR